MIENIQAALSIWLIVLLQGKYTILANVYTKDGDKVTCLTATVHFGS